MNGGRYGKEAKRARIAVLQAVVCKYVPIRGRLRCRKPFFALHYSIERKKERKKPFDNARTFVNFHIHGK